MNDNNIERASSTITPEFLVTIEPIIVSVIQQRIHIKQQLFEQSFWGVRFRKILYAVMLIACFYGVGFGFYLLFFDRSICRSSVISVLIIALFSIIAFYFRSFSRFTMIDLDKFAQKYAVRFAHKMLTQAKQQVPFVAEYEYKNNLVSYYRIKNNLATLAWSKPQPPIKIDYDGFTLFFKKELSCYPTMIVLHNGKDK